MRKQTTGRKQQKVKPQAPVKIVANGTRARKPANKVSIAGKKKTRTTMETTKHRVVHTMTKTVIEKVSSRVKKR